MIALPSPPPETFDMFKRISRNLKRYKATQQEFEHGEPLDLDQFGDPLALQTEWTPIAGASGIRMRRFSQSDPQVFRSKPTAAGVLFSLVFAIPLCGIGLVLLVFFLLSLTNASSFTGSLWLLLLVFLTAGPGCIPLYFTYKPIEFNKLNGHFRTGYQIPLLAKFTTDAFPLENICAVQAIKGHWSSSGHSERRRKNSARPSYEFNLVSGSGARLSLISHSNVKAIKTEARELSEFLEIPLWDAIPDWMAGDSPLPS